MPPRTATAAPIYKGQLELETVIEGKSEKNGHTFARPAAAMPVVNAPTMTCTPIAPLIVIRSRLAKAASPSAPVRNVTTNGPKKANRKHTLSLILVSLRHSSIYSGLQPLLDCLLLLQGARLDLPIPSTDTEEALTGITSGPRDINLEPLLDVSPGGGPSPTTVSSTRLIIDLGRGTLPTVFPLPRRSGTPGRSLSTPTSYVYS